MYAHVTNGTVDAIDQPPQYSYANGRWYDLRTLDPTTLAIVGWYQVIETTRPTDTATNTSTASYTFNGSTVTQVWNVVAKTQAQIDADTAATNGSTLITKATNALGNNTTFLANTTVSNYPGISNPTTAQTTAQVKALSTQVLALTRQIDALIKLQINDLSNTNGT